MPFSLGRPSGDGRPVRRRRATAGPRPPVRAGAALLAAGLLLAAGCGRAGVRQAPRPRTTPRAAAVRLTQPVTLAALRRWNPRAVAAGYASVGRLPITLAAGTGPTTGGTTGTDTGKSGGGNVEVWGRADVPNVQVLLAGGRVVGVRGIFAAADGPQPWFDSQTPTSGPGMNAGGAPGTNPGPGGGTTSGSVYGGGSVGQNAGNLPSPRPSGNAGSGTGATTPTSPAGPTSWYTQTVWFERSGQAGAYGLSSWDRLKQLNPALSQAKQLTPFVPTAGVVWGQNAPGLSFMVDKRNRVVGVEGTFGVGTGFQPMYDQMPGHYAVIAANGLKVYTQRISFVDPLSVR